MCVCRKYGLGLGRDYPVHQAGRWAWCAYTAATVQQRGNTHTSERFLKSRRCSCWEHMWSIMSVLQFAQCFFFDAEERDRRKVSNVMVLLSVQSVLTVFPSRHASLSLPVCLWLAILLHQLPLILSPCTLKQIESRQIHQATNMLYTP